MAEESGRKTAHLDTPRPELPSAIINHSRDVRGEQTLAPCGAPGQQLYAQNTSFENKLSFCHVRAATLFRDIVLIEVTPRLTFRYKHLRDLTMDFRALQSSVIVLSTGAVFPSQWNLVRLVTLGDRTANPWEHSSLIAVAGISWFFSLTYALRIARNLTSILTVVTICLVGDIFGKLVH
ncbi:hypothetical protein K470DRAFT_69307 [Piedraia hortae CBS 480.64]|uniref:Uncharacterized protein n=1 Tax=Piedraia hortae CBS 480.64 TaxID=1314780 RepID=A0A6A7BYZ9_9PEZI|nr:hypothetical protein K470DRAFT_69307 [Piedraia hortae CBS 480.64]